MWSHHLEVEIAIAKFLQEPHGVTSQKTHSSLLSAIHKLILYGVRKNCLISGRSLLLYQFIRRVIKMTVRIIMGYTCHELHTKFFEYIFLKVKSICR
jgi:hypothetical protein